MANRWGQPLRGAVMNIVVIWLSVSGLAENSWAQRESGGISQALPTIIEYTADTRLVPYSDVAQDLKTLRSALSDYLIKGELETFNVGIGDLKGESVTLVRLCAIFKGHKKDKTAEAFAKALRDSLSVMEARFPNTLACEASGR